MFNIFTKFDTFDVVFIRQKTAVLCGSLFIQYMYLLASEIRFVQWSAHRSMPSKVVDFGTGRKHIISEQ